MRRISVVRAAVPLLAAGVVVSGCQQAKGIGALNGCGTTVEVDTVSSVKVADDAPHWTSIAPGERADVRVLSDGADSAYVMVRRPGADDEVHKTIPLSDLDDAPGDVDYDKEIALTGGLCPR